MPDRVKYIKGYDEGRKARRAAKISGRPYENPYRDPAQASEARGYEDGWYGRKRLVRS